MVLATRSRRACVWAARQRATSVQARSGVREARRATKKPVVEALMELTTLSASELLSTLDLAWSAGNRALAKMLAYLGEVERRGLYVEIACTSMFAFLERRFGLTGGSAYRRLTAARLVRRFPTIL